MLMGSDLWRRLQSRRRRLFNRNCHFRNAISRFLFRSGWMSNSGIAKYGIMRDTAIDILAVTTHRGFFRFRQRANKGQQWLRKIPVLESGSTPFASSSRAWINTAFSTSTLRARTQFRDKQVSMVTITRIK